MDKLLRKIAASRRAVDIFKLISFISSVGTSLIFLLQLTLLFVRGDYTLMIKVGSIAATGFVLVTVVRRIINAPRPYELRDFYMESPRSKVGESFPSRHAYSAFVIATLAWLLHPAFSILAAVLGLAITVSRVLTGIHFVRDVVTGALLGIASGVIGIIIIV